MLTGCESGSPYGDRRVGGGADRRCGASVAAGCCGCDNRRSVLTGCEGGCTSGGVVMNMVEGRGVMEGRGAATGAGGDAMDDLELCETCCGISNSSFGMHAAWV